MGVDLVFNAIMAGWIKRCHGSFPSSLEVFSAFLGDRYQTPCQLAGF